MRVGHVYTWCLVMGALILLGQPPAHAQLVAACRGDVQRFCAGMAPGGGRIIGCLEQHAAKLSAGCQQAIGATQPAGPKGPAAGPAPAGGAGSAKAACRDDAMRLCADAVGNQPKMQQCLRSHAAQLSDGCKTALIAGGG